MFHADHPYAQALAGAAGRTCRAGRAVLVLAGALAALHAGAAEYPEKPIRLVVGNVAGGTPDFVARAIEPVLSSRLGQRLIVDNRPGAGGLVGTEAVARAAPDGYTLLVGGTSAFCLTPALQAKNNRYDAMRDFTHVAMLADSQLLVVSHPSVPAKNARELVDLAKRSPGKLSYASSGNGTTPHILGELFRHHARIAVQHIPYKGGPQAWTAVVGGEVELLVGQVQQAIPQVAAKRVRAHAVFGAKRSPALPDVPTFAESGLKGLDVTIWYSLAAPAGTPAPIVERLNREIANALAAPEPLTRLREAGVTPVTSTPQETTEFVRREIPRWAEAVRISNAQID